MRLRPTHAVMLLAALAAVHLAAQQVPPQTFRSGREVLTIEASVRDAQDGPLTDLRPEEFEVKIDGQPRRVLTAQPFGTDGGRAPAAADASPIPHFTSNADVSPGRLVVFAIDRDSMRPGGEKAAIETAAKMLDQLSPSDAAGAVGLPGSGIELTRDHAAVAAFIKTTMTGTMPSPDWQHALSWDEALAYERKMGRRSRRRPARVSEARQPAPGLCPPAS